VLYQDEVIVEGWLSSSVLEPVPGQDAIDPSRKTGLSRRLPALKVLGEPRLFTTTRRLPLRLRASESAAPVAFLTPTTEVLAIDEIADWVGVLPSELDIVAPGGGQFWVPARLVAEP
jgi:hypothetical protein